LVGTSICRSINHSTKGRPYTRLGFAANKPKDLEVDVILIVILKGTRRETEGSVLNANSEAEMRV
jgi:hypothetical protein